MIAGSESMEDSLDKVAFFCVVAAQNITDSGCKIQGLTSRVTAAIGSGRSAAEILPQCRSAVENKLPSHLRSKHPAPQLAAAPLTDHLWLERYSRICS